MRNVEKCAQLQTSRIAGKDPGMRGTLFALILLSGCGGLSDLFGDGSTPDAGNSDSNANGFSSPTVEVTINGTMHYGPSPPISGSGVSLQDVDSGQTVTQSTLTVDAINSQAGCSFTFARFASYGISPIAVGSYNVVTAADGITADGTVSPESNVTVVSGPDIASCAGTDCDGSALQILHVGTDFIEGYWEGNVTLSDNSATLQVTCSFYIPTTSITE
jgi:hypothetical protein